MMNTAFGEEAMSRVRGFEWFQPFNPRSGRPAISRNEDKIAQVKGVVHSDRGLTVPEISHRSVTFP
ncbi:hypothetical protein TNCV_5036731, partial [Trichonephila clavipes]